MRRTALALIAMMIATTAAVAQMHGPMYPDGPFEHFGQGPYLQEAKDVLADWGDEVPAQLTFDQIDALAGELSIPAQKAAFERSSAFASMVMPGVGQFMNEDYVSGSLFVLGDLAITAGTLVGIHFLLPEPVRLGNLDYFGTPKTEIKETWETELGRMSLGESLAIAGVVTGGAVLDHILGRFSAKHAADLARERIESGEVEFSAKPELIIGAGLIGLGMHMKY